MGQSPSIAIDSLLESAGYQGSTSYGMIRLLVSRAATQHERLDLRHMLTIARAISDLDACQGISDHVHVGEAMLYILNYGSSPYAAVTAPDGIRSRIMAIRAQLAKNGSYEPLRMRGEASDWTACPLCGLVKHKDQIREHGDHCADDRVARWHANHGCDQEESMQQSSCGCKYKIFNDNPLTLSVKTGCREGREASTSPALMAQHLGLIEKPTMETVSSERRSRTWSPR